MKNTGASVMSAVSRALRPGRVRDLERRIDELERRLRRSDAVIDVLLCDTRFEAGGEGGMNGQPGRKQVVADLFRAFGFGRIVETGTFFGATTGYLASTFGVPVLSCEAVRRHHFVARRLLRELPSVQLVLADSRSFLRELANSGAGLDVPTFFYLDAHWYEDLPLADEVDIIAGAWRECVMMIDDFRVPADPGYEYDDYGDGKSLELAYLRPTLERHALDAWFPVLPAREEGGKKRGCVVLARREARARMEGVASLVRWFE